MFTAECVAVLSIAKFEEGFDNSDLDLRMEEAMRTIASNIMGKESAPETANVVLALECDQADDPEPDQVYWGDNRLNGGARKPNPQNYQSFQGGQASRPHQQQLQQQPYRQYNNHHNQPGWNNNHPHKNQQGGWHDKNQRPQFPGGQGRFPGGQNQHYGGPDRGRRPYNVWYEDGQGNMFAAGEDGAPDIEDDDEPEEIWYSGPEQYGHIIIDTGSRYCVMGVNTREVLYNRMKAAGCEPPVLEYTNKSFKFGGSTDIYWAQTAITFEINLNGKPAIISAYIIPTHLPFIIGKQWLKDSEVQLDLGTQKMKINGAWMRTADTGTGHEGITWDATLHETENSEHPNSEKQAPSTNMGTNTENSATNEDRISQSTNKNPSAIRMNITVDDSSNCRDQHKDMAEVEDTDNDKAWPLMEIQYGPKSIAPPSTREKGNAESMNLLNETPEELDGEPRRDGLEDMEDERERHNVCIIL